LILESSLYLPVKRFLDDRGFVVKGEVGGRDRVALKESEAEVARPLPANPGHRVIRLRMP